MDIKKAGFTVEASLLIPAVVFILVLLIVSTTFLLDKNILISLSVCEAVCGRKQDDSSLTGLCHHEILCEKSDKQRSATYSVKSGFFGRLFYEEESVSYKEYDPAKLLKGEAAPWRVFQRGIIMDIFFEQDLQKTNVVIPAAALEIDSFELNLITRSRIPGLLPCYHHVSDSPSLIYDASSLRPLSAKMRRGFGQRDLKKLISSLWSFLNSLSDYLLSEKRVILDADYIFLSGDEKYRFIYLPSSAGETPKSNLAFQVMNAISDDDEECIVLGWKLFKALGKEDFVPDDLMSIISAKTNDEICVEPELSPNPTPVSSPNSMPILSPPQYESFDYFDNEAESEKSLFNISGKIMEKLRSFGKKNNIEKNDLSMQSKGPEIDLGLGIDLPDFEESDDSRTMLMSAPEPRPCLVPEEGNVFGKCYLEKDETVIGKLPSLSDFTIPNSTISRVHAKITKLEGSFYIEDAGSKNGTSVNNKMLSYGQIKEIKDGDLIRFAAVAFRFSKKALP